MAAATPTKRRRTDSIQSVVEVPIVRSTEYWFDDGNIVLQAESTQFRVAKSVLSRHSSVFRDMFTLPLPADEPTVENCPKCTRIDLLSSKRPVCLSSQLSYGRLSKKYDFPAFREDCVRRMKTEFPTTLKEYDELNDVDFKFIEFGEENVYSRFLPLTKEIGLPSALPLAYCGMIMRDRATYMPKILDANDGSLSPSDRLALLLGITNLQVLQSTTTVAWLEPHAHIPCETCTQKDECLAALKAIICEEASRHPPYLWAISAWHTDWGKDMCESCCTKAKEVFNAGRKESWEKLPSMFGLPEWEKLRTLDFE
ncbi:hypothetical protein K438DRAFT_1961174 [Mycena galopus ATCC 62051]|nr:hypothetical protein K438DRAFT_1961174 [Mycena galopus ATCC 62051]